MYFHFIQFLLNTTFFKLSVPQKVSAKHYFVHLNFDVQRKIKTKFAIFLGIAFLFLGVNRKI